PPPRPGFPPLAWVGAAETAGAAEPAGAGEWRSQPPSSSSCSVVRNSDTGVAVVGPGEVLFVGWASAVLASGLTPPPSPPPPSMPGIDRCSGTASPCAGALALARLVRITTPTVPPASSAHAHTGSGPSFLD